MTKTRTETDSFGPIEVPADKYWGAVTERSLENFKIGGHRIPLAVVHAFGVIKRASAQVNMALGLLDPKIGKAILMQRRKSSTASSTNISHWSCGRQVPARRPT